MTRPPLPDGFSERLVLDSGQEEGIWWFIYDAEWMGIVNGYAYIPEDHPLHRMGYDQLYDLLPTHGGLTFARDGWVGFDTGHAWDVWPRGLISFPYDLPWLDDSKANWTPGMVSEVAKELARTIARTAVVFEEEKTHGQHPRNEDR